ncbi:nuclear transport factor 2 family protein [Streptomyces sp. NPDC088387]|uniref:nuclear transport factor 2 family protein n=1 Tax=Streptomyces sp. NPDC088387 TaxID=3365859 RepID=UPI003811D998
MSRSPQEIFQRYVHAGAFSQDAAAVAEMFTEDGVLEAPLVPAGSVFPKRMRGRDEIREGLAAYYARQVPDTRKPDVEKSRYALHTTGDPDVFIAEIDTVLLSDGVEETVSLVQIFRIRDGRIALLRDYFTPGLVG